MFSILFVERSCVKCKIALVRESVQREFKNQVYIHLDDGAEVIVTRDRDFAKL